MRCGEGFVCRTEDIEHHVLEWISRHRPAHLVPVSLTPEGDQVRIRLHTDGLLPLTSGARAAFARHPNPSAWIAHMLLDIRELIDASENCLLDSSHFQLDPDSVWLRSAGDNHRAVSQPVLTYLPATADKYEAPDLEEGLHRIAAVLFQIAGDQDGQTKTMLSPDQLSDWLDRHRSSLPEEETKKSAARKWRFALAVSIAFVVLSLLIRWFPLADILRTGTASRVLAWSSFLGTLFVCAWLFLHPSSPLCIRTDSWFLGCRKKAVQRWSAFRYEARQDGLPMMVIRRLASLSQPASETRPLSPSDGTERLGFLSEGEPGTPAETEGLRAYLLTPEFLVGRDPDRADLVIPDSGIGRVHARIRRHEGSFFLTDLGSVNGTFLDHRRLDRHTETQLPDRCEIRFGERHFYFIAD